MIRMELSRIVITETDYHMIWLREKDGQRTFPIVIGIVEADAIRRKVREDRTRRPLTHDLLSNVITGLGAELERVVVNSLERRTFHAKLVLRRNGSIIEIDSRPSDAVAVAVRLDAPIFVQEEVLEHVCSGAHNPDNTPGADDPTIV